MSAVLRSKQMVHQQSGAALIFTQSSSILDKKRQRQDDDAEASSSNQPSPRVQQESTHRSLPPPPFPQTPPPPESPSSDSDIDDSTSLLEEKLSYSDETTATFVETDETESFHLSSKNQKIYDEASDWFENKTQRKLDDTIEGLRDNRFHIPWVHDLLYDRLKLLKCGLDSTTDENTYTSYWIAPDFTALRTGIDGLISKGFVNENHFWPSALRRRLVRGVENAKGTSVDGYWYALDGKVDVIFETSALPTAKTTERGTFTRSRVSETLLIPCFIDFSETAPWILPGNINLCCSLGEDLVIYTTCIVDGRKYHVRKIFQDKYEFSANRQASVLVHLQFCLVIKTIMEANQDVSFRFDKATSKKPTGVQTKNSLRMHISPKRDRTKG